jgi:hypothetical protein
VYLLGRRLGAEALDRLWLFPPLKQGRRESGLVAASCFIEARDDEGRRRVVTASYRAEMTGTGLSLEPLLREEGLAPTAVLPRVVSGVRTRSGLELGEPREVEVAGNPEALRELMSEFDLEMDEEPELAEEPEVAQGPHSAGQPQVAEPLRLDDEPQVAGEAGAP